MPGVRLTHEDRRQIATWLAGGLGYAEIARQLGKPTSTISREVARNSEAGKYLPDSAQQAATRRARRRKPAAGPEPATGEQPAARVRDFVEQFAILLAATGLPRMTARVFVCLLLSDAEGMTATDLVHRLRISPASVSKSIGYLETMDLVSRKTDSGRRRERYVIIDEVWLRAWRTDTGAHANIANAAQRGTEIFGADTPAGTRLAKMAQFFGWLSGQMSASRPTDATVDNALIVIAALVYAARPLTATDLGTSLGWPRQRVIDAVSAIEQQPELADPLALVVAKPGTYAITTRPGRLSPAQRKALRVAANVAAPQARKA